MAGADGISTYLRLFKGRADYLAQQGEDRYFPIQGSLGPFYVSRHFEGDVTFGLYVLTSQSTCHLVCVDVDIPKADLDLVDFRDRAAKYERLAPLLSALIQALETDFGIPRESMLLEETGGRGYHVWVLLAAPLSGETAVAFGRALKSRLSFEVEFFPKQGSLGPRRKYGNLIKLPLGVHQRYGLPSVFFCLADGCPHYCESLDESLALLERVHPADPSLLERAAEGHQAELRLDERIHQEQTDEARRSVFGGSISVLFTNCSAMHSIRAKAKAGEPLSHSEAFHFANTLLSHTDGEGSVHECMRDSFGDNYDERRTGVEISRIRPLFPTSCKTLVEQRLCLAYCKKSVEERNQDPLLINTSPCSVWLKRSPSHPAALPDDHVEALAAPETVERAFFRLRQYHEHEDSLFFDPFDFEMFETQLSSRARTFAQAFSERASIPLAGYLPVSIPKKLDDTLEMQYRRMSYSTVYDQVPIQTVFDIIAPSIEAALQPSSFGYRWNLDVSEPARIFEDWREAYPRFRGEIMEAIQRNPLGYHICCDIKGYYDHVNHDILLEQFRLVIPDEYIYSLLEQVVRMHRADPDQATGLPQGPAYARLLANLYLNDFDRSVQEITAAYFRYVDDFFLVFDSYKSAERGLEAVVGALRRLGLELSDDEQKRAVIEPNTELANIRRTLDKIQYGILEGTRQIQHLDPETVNDFYDAVERHSGSPEDLEQLITINDALPSLLYIVSQETLIPHDFRPKLLEISRHLIRRRWFCPKRLKSVFYRLLEIEPDKQRFIRLFDDMLPAHRVYFLLSVFGCWRSRGEHEALLNGLIAKALQDDDCFVLGFAIAMSAETEEGHVTSDGAAQNLAMPPSNATWFPLVRLLGSSGYAALTSDQQAAVRDTVTDRSPSFIQSSLLGSIQAVPSTYLEGTYLRGVLGKFNFLLLPEVARLLATATDRSEVFESMVGFVASTPSFKALAVSLVCSAIRDIRASAGRADMNNLDSLYRHVPDEELRDAMLAVLGSIYAYAVAPDEEFAKAHRQIDNYNGCYLFEKIGDGHEYQYLELMPEDRLRESLKREFDSTERILADLSAKHVLPPLLFSYDSAKKEITTRSTPHVGMVPPCRGAFALEPSQIAEGLRLAADIFKKAVYFRRATGKAPLVSLNNLLIDRSTGTAVFFTIGRSLATPFAISGVTIGEANTDISRMVSLLLQQMFFTTDADGAKFLAKKHHPPANAFLAHVILNMSAKEPSHRYSLARFNYLAEAFSHCQARSDDELVVFHLLERLKAGLFRHNPGSISWQGACSALNGHVSDVRVLFDKQALAAVPLRNRALGFSLTKGKLHWVSLQLLNLTMNRRALRSLQSADPTYLDLIKCLMLYGVVCVETVALCRAVWGEDLLDTRRYVPLLDAETVVVSASDFEQKIPCSDFAALFTYRPDGTGKDIKDLSLRQVALLAVLAGGGDIKGDHVHIERPHGLPPERFDDLVHACLFRIPRLEEKAHEWFSAVSCALLSGDDLTVNIDMQSLHRTIEVIASDFTRLRRRMKLRRRNGWADGKKFPEKIVCKSHFRRVQAVRDDVIPAMALVNSFPSSKYRCSWDMSRDVVTSLVIASPGLYSFLVDLKKGKLFGRKLSYLYTGRAMLPWDFALFVGTLLVMALVKGGEDVFQSGFLKAACEAASNLLAVFAPPLFIKIVYDLRHWSRSLKDFISHIRGASQFETDD